MVDAVAQSAQAAADATAAQIENTQNEAAAVVAAVTQEAAQRVNNAEAAAAQIAQAATETELGARLRAVEERTGEWTNKFTTLEANQTQTQTLLGEIAGRLSS